MWISRTATVRNHHSSLDLEGHCGEWQGSLTHLPYCSCPSPPGLPLGTSGKSLAPIFSLLGSCGQRDLPFLPLLPAEQAWVLAFLSPCAPVPNHLGLTPVWQYLSCYLLQPYFLQTLQSLKLVPSQGRGTLFLHLLSFSLILILMLLPIKAPLVI